MTGELDTVLRDMEAVAYRFDGARFAWGSDIGLPTGFRAFQTLLGNGAQTRAHSIAAKTDYRTCWNADGRMFEEIGRRAPDGTLAGFVRVVEDNRGKGWTSLTVDQILAALNDRRVAIAFQPIVDARSRTVHHYECLLRVEDAGGRFWPTPQVIESAEALGLVPLLDRRVLEIASRALIGTDVKLALNVSAQTVADLDAANGYLEAVRTLGAAARRLTLELTETVAVNDPTLAARFATIARGHGCRFAIDDFGSGYTSFRNLMAIEADAIKIDGDYVDGLLASRQSQTFVRMMVDLAQTFGVETVAERVETEDVADMLTDMGVDRLQGYLFGKPELGLERVAA